MEKYLYFRVVADEDDDDGDGASGGINPTSLCIPVRNITGIAPQSHQSILISFKSIRNNPGFAGASGDEVVCDTVEMAINTHTHKAVIDRIIRAINDPVHNDGFIDVCDDVTTNTANETVEAVRIHPDITGIADNRITVQAALS